MEFKPIWEERQKEIIGDELNTLKEYMKKPLPTSIRLNTLKISREELIKRLEEKGWRFKQVPFYKDGIIFEKKPHALGNTIEHFLGYIYIQETASMIPPIVLDLKETDTVLDMAAAPGSKTTQMAQIMNNNGTIIASEKFLKRMFSLRANLQRCGVRNVVATGMDGRRFKKISTKFDKISLDAPCSGTGIIMKSPHTKKIWSVKTSEVAAGLQKQLIASAIQSLKDDGTLVYSTCSIEPEENEAVIDYAIKKYGMKVEKIELKDFKTREGITSWGKHDFSEEVKNSLRIYPQDNDTSGFFVAKLVK